MSDNANRRSIVVKDVLWDKLKAVSEREGRSLSELVREALIDLLTKKSEIKHYDPIKDTYGRPLQT